MKKFALFIFAVMFLANTFVVSAWAKPCLNSMSIESSQSMGEAMPGDMPCHGDQKGQGSHCDGVCLCLHASVSQTPIIGDVERLGFLLFPFERFAVSDDSLVSRSALPPRRPPKFIS